MTHTPTIHRVQLVLTLPEMIRRAILSAWRSRSGPVAPPTEAQLRKVLDTLPAKEWEDVIREAITKCTVEPAPIHLQDSDMSVVERLQASRKADLRREPPLLGRQHTPMYIVGTVSSNGEDYAAHPTALAAEGAIVDLLEDGFTLSEVKAYYAQPLSVEANVETKRTVHSVKLG